MSIIGYLIMEHELFIITEIEDWIMHESYFDSFTVHEKGAGDFELV